MNKLSAALCSLSAILAISVSCEKEPVTLPEEATDAKLTTVSLTVSMPDDVDSKINSDSSKPYIIKWNSSAESIGVIGKLGGVVKYYEFSHEKLSAASVSATFTCSSVDDGAQLLYAVYPYTSYNHTDNPWDGTSEAIPLTLNNTQSCGSAMGITSNALLVSKISGSSIALKHVCGYLKLNMPERYQRWADNAGTSFKSSTDVKRVLVSSTSTLCGSITVSFNNDGTLKAVDKSGATGKMLTCVTKKNTAPVYKSFGSHESDSEGAWTPGVMYIPVLPGTYSDFDITLEYRSDMTGTAVSSYVAESRGTNTFTSGVALGGSTGVTMSGPFVPSFAITAISKAGTTLSFSGSASVWTYSGIVLSDYTFKYAYRESGSSDAWTEVNATYTSGTVSAEATVDGGKSYEAKMIITANGSTFESDIKAEGSIKSVCFDFSTGSYGTFEYFTTGAESGYHKFVDKDGNDIFPNHNVGETATANTYYIKEWNGSSFGEKVYATSTAKTLGMNLTKEGFNATIEHCTKYYCITGGVWCPQKVYIHLYCPTGKKITRILGEVDAATSQTNRNMYLGLGNAKGNTSVIAQTSITAYGKKSTATVDASEKGLGKSITMVVPSPAVDTDYWLYVDGRCSRFTVYYE